MQVGHEVVFPVAVFSNYESNVLLVVNVVLAKGIQIYQKESLLAKEILI